MSGGSWTAPTAPLPTGAAKPPKEHGQLYTVSCSGASCAAGGTVSLPTAYASGGLLETFAQSPSGYFEAASDGGIFAFTVPFYGSEGGKPLNEPIVDAVADPHHRWVLRGGQ